MKKHHDPNKKDQRDFSVEYDSLFPKPNDTSCQQWKQEGDIIEEFSLLDESIHSTTSSSIII